VNKNQPPEPDKSPAICNSLTTILAESPQ